MSTHLYGVTDVDINAQLGHVRTLFLWVGFVGEKGKQARLQVGTYVKKLIQFQVIGIKFFLKQLKRFTVAQLVEKQTVEDNGDYGSHSAVKK